MKLLPAAIAALAATAVASPAVGSAGDFPAPRYYLDLDAPALDRWAPLVDATLDLHGWNSSFGVVAEYLREEVMPLEAFRRVDAELEAAGLALLGMNYMEELHGILAAAKRRGHDDLTTGMLVFLQFFYEFVMECTGIVAQDASGIVTHGRNMDIHLLLTNLTAEVTWVKEGKAFVTSTQFLGHLGIHTGMRLGGGWSAQINQRTKLELGPWGWDKTVVGHNLLALLRGNRSPGFILREALMEVSDFAGAVPRLSSVKSDSPMYFILAGAGRSEGAVITRSREGLAPSPGNTSAQRMLSEQRYLVQTNWDTWIPVDEEECRDAVHVFPQKLDDACSRVLRLLFGMDQGGCAAICGKFSDGRRKAAVQGMQKLAVSDISFDSVLEVLSTPPVLDPWTIFTSLMRPATEEYRTTVRAQAPRVAARQRGQSEQGLQIAAIQVFRRLVDLGEWLRAQEEVIV
mmetsp:Transcript_130523/g.278947  ORF Transcript_130523/g.278947 Transcript_130523/m.278947 type:complete len:458 (-) Transcript_130523:58-1431(-)